MNNEGWVVMGKDEPLELSRVVEGFLYVESGEDLRPHAIFGSKEKANAFLDDLGSQENVEKEDYIVRRVAISFPED